MRAESDVATAERLRQLEAKAAQVDLLVDRVEKLQGTVVNLQQKLHQYESREDPRSGQRLALLREQVAQILGEIDQQSSGHGYGGYGQGLEMTFWGWLTYLTSSSGDRNTFWAWEVEMDVTKTFSETLAAGFDLEFVDTNDGADVEIEQLFLSAVLSRKHQTMLTVGKFNAPFGIEERDFWDRTTASMSLLWRAMPHDFTGAMLTQPLGDTNVTLRPFLINGFDDDLDINEQPSLGLTASWEPSQKLHLAVTNMYGPEMADNLGDKLYLLLVEGTWDATAQLSISAEYLFGTTEAPDGRRSWQGAAAIVNYDLNEKWRVFGRWSWLDDPDGFVAGSSSERYEAAVGFALYLHPLVECRAEYRHDFVQGDDDIDGAQAHVTFGF